MSIPPTTDQVQGPAIHVQGLEKSYKALRVLRGVDFDVARGSIFALLRSNGAGKTTMVKILSTLLKADTGTARVNGFDVATQAADVRESISLTGQFTAVDQILSGRENLVLVARLRHLKDPGAILRALIKQADPAIVEEVKWKMPSRPEGLPVWCHNGIVCIAEPFKRAVKLTFFKGAQMKDPKKMFNSRLKSKTDRAIDFHEGDSIDESGLTGLVREAVELNKSAAK
jgi:hypothetical protein